MTASGDSCDVLIVGGGLVGSALANALSRIPVRTVLVEAHDPAAFAQPGFDGRATALANGSKRILEQLGLWSTVAGEAEPIHTIHVGEQGRFGAARIRAEAEGVEALGYTIENRALGAALWKPLEDAPGFTCLAPAKLATFTGGDDAVTAEVDVGGRALTIRARLLIAADGARSSVRRSLQIPVRENDYGQRAIIVNMTTEAALAGRAFERFTPQGPLAVLPLARGRAAVVWTLGHAEADRVMALGDAAFRDELQAAFGFRLGRIERVGRRALHTLSRVRSDTLSDRRTLLVGNAAVSLHPVAGQGFNLALRDVATIAEIIADDAASPGDRADAGSAQVLARYGEWRRDDQRKVAWFTHGLIRGFGARAPGLGALRGLGLVAFDLVPGAKALLARHTMGMAGRLPRLARGLPLS